QHDRFDRRSGGSTEHRKEIVEGEQHFRAKVPELVLELPFLEHRVARTCSRSEPLDGKTRDHELRRVLHEYRDGVAPGYSASRKIRGELLDLTLELAVGVRRSGAGDRRQSGMGTCRLFAIGVLRTIPSPSLSNRHAGPCHV